MRIVFIGPPGSGKGTQARLLQDRLGYFHLSTGDLLRTAIREGTPCGKLVEPYVVGGQLVPDQIVNELVSEYFHGPKAPKRFVLDGYPRTAAQAEYLDNILADCALPLDRAMLFSVPDEELLQRLDACGTPSGRADDNASTIRRRLELYHATTDGVIEYYRRRGLLVEIAAAGEIEEIHKAVLAHTA